MNAATATRVGAVLRKARGARSLRQIADRLGVSIPYLSDVERGRRSINPRRLRQLAEMLGLDREAIRALYVKAGCLPPLVERRAMRATDAWDLDPGAMRRALLDLRAHATLDDELRSKIDAGLGPVDW